MMMFLFLKKLINIYFLHNPSIAKRLKYRFYISGLFRSLKLTKNADVDKYKYSSYSGGFNSYSEFLFTEWSMGRNLIFGADMSSSVYTDNKNKEGPTQGSDGTTLIAEAKYRIKFSETRKRLVLNLHYSEATVSCLLML